MLPAAGAMLLALLMLPAAAAAAPALSLERNSDDFLEYEGSMTRLTGQLTGVTLGNSNRTVTLRASAFPYASEAAIGSTATDASGRFSFDVEPDFNIRYRAVFNGGAVLGSAASPEVQVFVFAKLRFRLGVRRNRALGRLRLRYSPNVNPDPLPGKRVAWYFRKVRQSHFRRVGRSTFKSRWPRDGVTTTFRYRLPRSRRGYRFEMLVCVPKARGDAGVGDRSRLRCLKRVPARRRASAASASADPGAGAPVIVGAGVAGG